MMHQSLFLDRDGVINVDHMCMHKEDSFELIDRIFELVRKVRSFNYFVIVATN